MVDWMASNQARTTAALRPLARFAALGARVVRSPQPDSPKDETTNRIHNALSESHLKPESASRANESG